MPRGEAFVYEAKYGLNRQSAALIGVCLAFCVPCILFPTPLWIRIFVIGFFGPGALLCIAISLTRMTALRIDASGVTLRRYLVRPAVFFPWEDVERLLLWQYPQTWHVGVLRREGAAPLLMPLNPRVARVGLPLETAATAVPAAGWFLDRKRLAAAVACFAPTVEVVDATTGRLLSSPPAAGT